MKPSEVARNYILIGVNKSRQSLLRTFIMAIYGGLFVGYGGLVAGATSYNIEPAAIGRVMQGFFFPIALFMIICGGGELFTGNSLLIIPLLEGYITIGDMLKSLGVVYAGNAIGSLFLTVLAVYGHVFDLFNKGLAESAVETAYTKLHLSFGDAFLRGILCNILVGLAVWLAMSTKEMSGKILAMWPPIFVFAAVGFEHCIANFYLIPAGLIVKEEYDVLAETSGVNWGRFVYKSIIPVTLGNLVGGIIIDGLGFWFLYFYLRRWEIRHQVGDLSTSKAERVIRAEDTNQPVPSFIHPIKKEETPENKNDEGNDNKEGTSPMVMH